MAMTKREMFTAIITFLEVAPANMDATPEGLDPEEFLNDAIVALKHEIELLDRKRGKTGPTKEQRANAAFKDEIVTLLEDADEPMTATDIGKAFDVTTQKATAMLKQLTDEQRVIRDKSGKKLTFTV